MLHALQAFCVPFYSQGISICVVGVSFMIGVQNSL